MIKNLELKIMKYNYKIGIINKKFNIWIKRKKLGYINKSLIICFYKNYYFIIIKLIYDKFNKNLNS